MKKKVKNNKGFSMIEVMLSVFVLSVGLVGVIGLIGNSIQHSMDSRNTIIAVELAQEGVELVRNVRDNNLADGDLAFDNIVASNFCRIDYSNNSWTCGNGLSGGNDIPYRYTLRYDSSTGFYYHTNGLPNERTKFARRIRIVGSGDDREITSIVSWKGEYPDDSNCTVATKCTKVTATLVE